MSPNVRLLRRPMAFKSSKPIGEAGTEEVSQITMQECAIVETPLNLTDDSDHQILPTFS